MLVISLRAHQALSDISRQDVRLELVRQETLPGGDYVRFLEGGGYTFRNEHRYTGELVRSRLVLPRVRLRS